ncbi:MAG: hypothetical protein WCW67_01405 [Candidatus Margulisiibacteriota bacterium]
MSIKLPKISIDLSRLSRVAPRPAAASPLDFPQAIGKVCAAFYQTTGATLVPVLGAKGRTLAVVPPKVFVPISSGREENLGHLSRLAEELTLILIDPKRCNEHNLPLHNFAFLPGSEARVRIFQERVRSLTSLMPGKGAELNAFRCVEKAKRELAVCERALEFLPAEFQFNEYFRKYRLATVLDGLMHVFVNGHAVKEESLDSSFDRLAEIALYTVLCMKINPAERKLHTEVSARIGDLSNRKTGLAAFEEVWQRQPADQGDRIAELARQGSSPEIMMGELEKARRQLIRTRAQRDEFEVQVLITHSAIILQQSYLRFFHVLRALSGAYAVVPMHSNS